MSKESTLEATFDKAERLGVVGSPSSTNGFLIDILGSASNKGLVGSLCVFKYDQDSLNHYALGQITEVQMQNIWLQDPTMKGLVRQRGRVDPITERQDTHNAKMMVSAVFSTDTSHSVEQSMLRTVPPTGTSIKQIEEDFLNILLNEFSEELFYLGNAYGTNIPLPMWLKHFGKGPDGAGEAYHIGVFGKTGSGKSVVAKMLLSGYARHKEMSILVLDPQGEFSKEIREGGILNKILSSLNRSVEVVSIQNLVLSGNGYNLFKEVLIASGFLKERMNIVADDNQERAATTIVNILQKRSSNKHLLKPIKIEKAHEKKSFDLLRLELLEETQLVKIYSGKDGQEKVRNALELDEDAIYESWRKIANLFSDRTNNMSKKIENLVSEITNNNDGKIVIVDLSETSAPLDILWTENIRFLVIRELLKELTTQAETEYKSNRLLNTLVIADEAHRLAPKEKPDNEFLDEVRTTFIDSVRTTRKYGLGWMFVSQSLYSLHREILNQMRISFFGFGLGWGIELLALKELIGGASEMIKLYQQFRDPQSSLHKKEYPFMAVGPVSPLSFAGTPLFFISSDYTKEFFKSNFEK